MDDDAFGDLTYDFDDVHDPAQNAFDDDNNLLPESSIENK